ncbi:hypothetical protein [Streptomyces griseoluteus]|uniref:hypothetical protein n=1 Tax=Streptomyces griseoluteus TaxID=29306 RepID=UPI0036CFB2C9
MLVVGELSWNWNFGEVVVNTSTAVLKVPVPPASRDAGRPLLRVMRLVMRVMAGAPVRSLLRAGNCGEQV